MMRLSPFLATCALAFTAVAPAAEAVTLSADQHGQVLVFPYYSVRATPNGAYNTYISLTNTSYLGKAVRLVFREGRAGRSVFEMNIYLSPVDMWTGALVPDASGGFRLVSADQSCTDPAVTSSGIVVSSAALQDSNDGLGTEAARVTEGYVEAFEMAAVSVDATNNFPAYIYPDIIHYGAVRQCSFMPSASSPPTTLVAPAGGLIGAADLIDVSNAMHFSYVPTALDQVATTTYFALPSARNAVGFDSPAINPVSVIDIDGTTYRSTWPRGIDAVSAALSGANMAGEYVLDSATASQTDWVLTFPTRRFYAPSSAAPFDEKVSGAGQANCQGLYIKSASRDQYSTNMPNPNDIACLDDGCVTPPPTRLVCWSTTVTSFRNSVGKSLSSSDVLAGANTSLMTVPAADVHGWAYTGLKGTMTPLQTLALDSVTGTTSAATVTYRGLPVVGFSVQTFNNGTLSCGTATCRGSYGGAFDLRRMRARVFPFGS